ncbi:MAG: hypothetical protein ACXADW_08630 [Candidatus Hodarchaeales archaeon]|jgi:hypothetical protein
MIIPANTSASGLDIFLRFNNILTDPLLISYVIKEPAGSTIGSDVGTKISTGHYDARKTVIPSGFSITEPWVITWTFTSPNNVTSSVKEEFCVHEIAAPIDVDDIIELVKLDLGLTTEFTQAQYETFVSKAITRINRRIRLTGTSDALSFNTTTGAITPTPNDSIFDLVLLQTECLIVKRVVRDVVGRGIRVKDGETEIDTTARFSGDREAVKDVCEELDDAIKDYLASGGDTSSRYADVIWYGNSRIIGTMDHDGQGSGRRRGFASTFEDPHTTGSVGR